MRSVRFVVALLAPLVAAGCFEPSSVQCPGGLVCPAGTTCAAKQSVCIKTLCGNGVIDSAAGEVCDDGNIVDGDGCSASCKSNETCGNGVTDSAAGEVCDDGNTTSGDGCSADCKSDETCGNGIVDSARGEVCDDGNNESGDGCSADCKSGERCGNGVVDVTQGEVCDKGADNAKCTGCSIDCRSNQTCGNGIVDACKGEVCDDGNNVAGDGCSADCKSNETCGNGVVDTVKGEVCDDGNTASGDGCSADCKSEEKCGNGTVDIGEQCDPGTDPTHPCGPGEDCPAETAACNRDCTVAFCGDGKINHARGEECDDGVETAGCNANCTLSACGDGILNVVAGEQCDAGNGMSPGACTATCTTTTDCLSKSCTTDSCTTSCVATADIANCNGNTAGAAKCQTSACGDGHVNSAAGETCDNLGGADGNGCNGKNAGAVSCHDAVCGDGYVNTAAGEECDTLGGADTQTCNGNSAAAKSVNADCKIPKCGDGYTNGMAGETCDHLGGADALDCNGKSAGAVACKTPSCGDGYANGAASEDCDTSGGADTAGCNGNSAAATTAGVACKFAGCGDLYANGAAGETCDKGAADSATCNGNSVAAKNLGVACHAAQCGDGYKNGAAATPSGGEQCDKGTSNSNSGDCLTSCKLAGCGDGFVEAGVESCDTGSTNTSGGCSTCSAPDPGWSCTLPSPPGPSLCAPVCGDGDVITNAATSSLDEVCDDHNASACGLCSNANGCTAALNAQAVAKTAATGSITSAGGNNISDGQVFTLSDGAHALSFEFDRNNSWGAGNVRITYANTTSANTLGCRICTAINGSGLNISATNSRCSPPTTVCCCGTGDSSISLANKTPGAVGNVQITTSVTRSSFSGMQGGKAEDCATGVGCTNDDDCASDVCDLSQTCPGGVACGTCAAPSCTDSKKNGLETATDCGGGTCAACADGLGCVANSDCVSGVCASTVASTTGSGTCAAPACNDKVQNGLETDVDCGGGTCPQCPDGGSCKANSDCQPPAVAAPVTATTTSGICDTAGSASCVPASILQVAVTGTGTVSSAATALETGDITSCAAASGTCVQSYDPAESVVLTATSTATTGSITWTVSGGQTCASCALSATVQTCPCTVSMSTNVSVAASVP